MFDVECSMFDVQRDRQLNIELPTLNAEHPTQARFNPAMAENPPTPPPPRQLEYGSDGVDVPKRTASSRFMLVLVWGLGLVSWAIWMAIIVYLFLKFLVVGDIRPRVGDSF